MTTGNTRPAGGVAGGGADEGVAVGGGSGAASSRVPVIDLTQDSPYPGLAAFRERDAPFFHGRRGPVEDCVEMVRRSTASLLFGASGLGKTSLLGAGVCPELRKLDFLPVHVRLRYAQSGVSLASDVVKQILAEVERRNVEVEEVAAARPDGSPADEETQRAVRATLWGFAHYTRFWSQNNHLLVPVIVLDQFEEMFTTGRDDPRSAAFLDALAEAVDYSRPDALRALVKEEKLEIPPAPDKPRLRCLIAMREDFLPELEVVRKRLPAIATRRYRLLRLRGEDAIAAICEPSPGLVTREVALKILDYLARENRRRAGGSAAAKVPAVGAAPAAEVPQELSAREVEPALLSLFCRGLNERRLRENRDKIDAELVKQSSGSILRDFYLESVRDASQKTREIIEEQLLSTSGFRMSMPVSMALQKGAPEEDLRRLIDRRLLRLEERFGEPHIELIHDVLTGEIREIRAERERKDAQEAFERKQRDDERRRLRWILGGVFGLLIALVGTGWYVIRVVLPAREKQAEYKGLLEQLRAAGAAGNFQACVEAHKKLNWVANSDISDELQGTARSEYEKCASAEKDRRKKLAEGLRREAEVQDRAGDHERALISSVEAAALESEEKLWPPGLPDSHLARTLRGHREKPCCVAFGQGGTLYSLGADGVRVWSAAEGKAIDQLPLPTAATFVPSGLSVRTEDGRDLVIAVLHRLKAKAPGVQAPEVEASTVAVWDMRSARSEPRRFDADHPLTKAVLLPGGEELIAASNGIERISLPSSGKAQVLEQVALDSTILWQVVLLRDGKSVLGAGNSFPGGRAYAAIWETSLLGKPAVLLQGTLSDGGAMVTSAAADQADFAFGFSAGEVLRLSPGATGIARKTAFQDSTRAISALAACATNSSVYAAVNPNSESSLPPGVRRGLVMRVDPKEDLLGLPSANVLDLAISADCKWLASAWDDLTVRVAWSDESRPFPNHPEALASDLRDRLGYPRADLAAGTPNAPLKSASPGASTGGDKAPPQ